jgi:HAD superfamily hydrolase (TIGR01662 family)
MAISAIVFDVGETLLDESRLRQAWADWLRVSRARLEHALRDAIVAREHHARAFERLRPGARIEQFRAACLAPDLTEGDLYPDALPCLAALRNRGYRVGVVGNQRSAIERIFEQLPVHFDLVGSSERWGLAKPSAAFFARLLRELSLPAGEVAYVGDRVDNDVLPANAAGMKSVLILRGPWAAVQAQWQEASSAHLQIQTLNDLPEAIGRL